MKPIELLQEHCKFITKYDCYVLLAVSRKKDTPEITNSQEIVFREVVKNETDIIRKYNKIKAQLINYKDEEGKSFPFYLYISLNRRDSKRANFMLINKLLGWVEAESNGEDKSRMFKKTYGHFYSCLMLKECRSKGQKHFMLDVDTKNKEKIQKISDILNHYLFPFGALKQETRNGFHFKVQPFNRVKFNEDLELHGLTDICEVKVDANLFVEYINKKE